MAHLQSQSAVLELGPWFHNLHLPDGAQTAPDHPLGDFPANKWAEIASSLPPDLTGWTVLDIGCNAGFYSFQLAGRGAEVTGVDHDERYLAQARWAADQFELADRVRFEKRQIYDLSQIDQQYDLVWFMGVFYHLRYPLLGLDIVARRTKRLMMFQTLTMPGNEFADVPDDFPLGDRDRLQEPGWPKMAFVEKQMAGDPTNWWAANHVGVEALLRSAGFEVLEHPAHEVYLCRRIDNLDEWSREALQREFLAATGQGEDE